MKCAIKVINNDRGYYATTSISKGEILLDWEAPMIGTSNIITHDLEIVNIKNNWSKNKNSCKFCYMAKEIVKDENLCRKVKLLKPAVRFVKPECTDMYTEELKQIHNRIRGNRKILDDLINDEGLTYACALYYKGSMVNHRCINYNAAQIYSRGFYNLISTRDISEGEEITISYLTMTSMMLNKTKERRRHIRQMYGFYCMCPDCDQSLHSKDPPEIVKLMNVIKASTNSVDQNIDACEALLRNFYDAIKGESDIKILISYYVTALICCGAITKSRMAPALGALAAIFNGDNASSFDPIQRENFQIVLDMTPKLKHELNELLQKYYRCQNDITWFIKWQSEICDNFSLGYNC